MDKKLAELGHTVRVIALIVGAIVVALLAWSLVAFLTGIIFQIIKFALLLAVLYVVFLFARSALRGRTSS